MSILAWLFRRIGGNTKITKASDGGVAVAGDNYGSIIVGSFPAEVLDAAETTGQSLIQNLLDAARANISAATRMRFSGESLVNNTFSITRRPATNTQTSESSDQISVSDIASIVAAGQSIFLCGDGGIGKTTALLSIADEMLSKDGCDRIPLFVSAPAWAASNEEIFTYIASGTIYSNRRVDAKQLSKLSEQGKISVLIDGWNEIATSCTEACFYRLQEFQTSNTNVSIVVATRGLSQRPDMRDAPVVTVLGIVWQQQQSYIRAQLLEHDANQLIDELSRNHMIRHAARNPLILQGIVRIGSKNLAASSTYDLFGAVVEAYESEGARRTIMGASPIYGLHRAYLSCLAWAMNEAGSSLISVAVASTAIGKEIGSLLLNGQLSSGPEAHDVLRELGDHHLLVVDNGSVRFAHQRFQDYYSATSSLNLLASQDASAEKSLEQALNAPFWEESLVMVADHLAKSSTNKAAKARLVGMALRIDPHLSALAICASRFVRHEGETVYDHVVSVFDRLSTSPHGDISEYGMACIVDSQLSEFSSKLWPLLEHADENKRFDFHRCARSRISIGQLGPTARHRIAGWNAERKREFIGEVASNQSNWEDLQNWSNNEPDVQTRAAAISAMRWEFPASGAWLDAWLTAPDPVKLELIGLLDADLIEAGGIYHQEVSRLYGELSDELKDDFAFRFASILPPPSEDYIVKGLVRNGATFEVKSLVEIAARHYPSLLAKLAKDQLIGNAYPPEWATQTVGAMSTEEKELLFKDSLRDMLDLDQRSVARAHIAAMASQGQVREALIDLLKERTSLKATAPSKRDGERYFALSSLAHNLDGTLLVRALIEISPSLTEDERIWGVEVLDHRANSSYDSEGRIPWSPTVDEADALSTSLLAEPCSLELVCKTLSLVVQSGSSDVIERLSSASRREMRAWLAYRTDMSAWADSGGVRSRPERPGNQQSLLRSWSRVGWEALPALIEMSAEEEAHEVIIPALLNILEQPWRAQLPSRSYALDVRHFKSLRRNTGRVLLQPEAGLQRDSDECARALLTVLDRCLADVESLELDSQIKLARAKLSTVLNAVARIPSLLVADPVLAAIERGLVSEKSAVDALYSLTAQGVVLDRPALAASLCSMWEEKSQVRWMDASALYDFRRVSEVLLHVPHHLLRKDPSYYLSRWVELDGTHDVYQLVGSSGLLENFRLLCQMYDAKPVKSYHLDSLSAAIVDSLSVWSVDAFCELLRTGMPFEQWRSSYHSQQISDRIVNRLPAGEGVQRIVDACVFQNTEQSVAMAFQLLDSSGASDEYSASVARRIFSDLNVSLPTGAVIEMRRLFKRTERTEQGWISTLPKASNSVRLFIYELAVGSSRFSTESCRLLARLEKDRIEDGRPSDEPRHPFVGSGAGIHSVFLAA